METESKRSIDNAQFVLEVMTDDAEICMMGIDYSGWIFCNCYQGYGGPEYDLLKECSHIQRMFGNPINSAQFLLQALEDRFATRTIEEEDLLVLKVPLWLSITQVDSIEISITDFVGKNIAVLKESFIRTDESETFGYFVPGQDGLAVLSDIMLDWLVDNIVNQVQCRSKIHFKATRNDKQIITVADAISYYKTNHCVKCEEYLAKSALDNEKLAELIPDDDKVSGWAVPPTIVSMTQSSSNPSYPKAIYSGGKTFSVNANQTIENSVLNALIKQSKVT